MFLDCGRKPENPERTHAARREYGDPKQKDPGCPHRDANRRPSCCEATMLTSAPPCSPNTGVISHFVKVFCSRCPPEWMLLKSSCYRFAHHEVAAQKNWSDSRADCIRQGGDLLVINNLEEQNFVRKSSSNIWWENGYWMGLTDLVSEGTWVWINNVTEAETMYWRNGQPSHGEPQSGNCAAIYYYHDSMKSWYNANCQHPLSFICEMKARVI
uniref:C-type lectin domain-containing protein n=1 Tax=Stegastes partitus TaxID=144197 RepID=A0A3B4ZXY9_9TELE